MKEFSSIESFRHLIKSVRATFGRAGKPLPTLKYTGTVKIHGTNAGVRVTDTRIQPQKRSTIVDIGSDNYGFAAFCEGRKNLFSTLAMLIYGIDNLKNGHDITIFGEWAGTGIQKKVAVSNLDKHFIIFNAWKTREGYISIDEITKNIKNINQFNEFGIYFINQVPTYTVNVDFADPEKVLAELDEYTLAVEKECPWGTFRGTTGVGEGIVWVPANDPTNSDMWFKTKGLEHKNVNEGTKTRTEMDPVKVNSIREYVAAVLPEWRLEQGISQLKQDGKEIVPENTGAFLKWVCQDVIKEETDVLVANNLCWKDVVGQLNITSRQYYLKECEKEAFN
jgi:hypothetical protein